MKHKVHIPELLHCTFFCPSLTFLSFLSAHFTSASSIKVGTFSTTLSSTSILFTVSTTFPPLLLAHLPSTSSTPNNTTPSPTPVTTKNPLPAAYPTHPPTPANNTVNFTNKILLNHNSSPALTRLTNPTLHTNANITITPHTSIIPTNTVRLTSLPTPSTSRLVSRRRCSSAWSLCVTRLLTTRSMSARRARRTESISRRVLRTVVSASWRLLRATVEPWVSVSWRRVSKVVRVSRRRREVWLRRWVVRLVDSERKREMVVFREVRVPSKGEGVLGGGGADMVVDGDTGGV
ncbi:hypothetical protein BJ508DRAFT_338919 [Ascobolus immersus RN42]|uniref:Uncharacterized protein n=1 Tax=Ascobolus immersus RN42 TaxID=1160509 RepID=A0A3N4IJU7_ASCIM|nr:hypothetical protein BJ508DRAFT_338919 [Ascobolus immersus RN42]